MQRRDSVDSYASRLTEEDEPELKEEIAVQKEVEL